MMKAMGNTHRGERSRGQKFVKETGTQVAELPRFSSDPDQGPVSC
jgi:hypothetical protein